MAIKLKLLLSIHNQCALNCLNIWKAEENRSPMFFGSANRTISQRSMNEKTRGLRNLLTSSQKTQIPQTCWSSGLSSPEPFIIFFIWTMSFSLVLSQIVCMELSIKTKIHIASHTDSKKHNCNRIQYNIIVMIRETS